MIPFIFLPEREGQQKCLSAQPKHEPAFIPFDQALFSMANVVVVVVVNQHVEVFGHQSKGTLYSLCIMNGADFAVT